VRPSASSASTDLRFRRPTEDDHGRVLAVMEQWWGGLGGADGARRRAALLPRLFFQHFTTTSTVVEHPDGRLAAFLVGFPSPAEPGTAYVHFVGVDPAARRTGLGAALYRRFVDQVSRAGVRTIRAITGPGNAQSIAFHTALGFTVSPVRPDYDGPGDDRVCFTRTLPSDGLAALLRTLSPRLHEGAHVFTTVDGAVPPGAVVTVREDEGLTVVLPRQQADELGLAYTFVAGWITLEVRSALDAVGLTAAVSRALADAGISANVVAAVHHDHVFVPYDEAGAALRVLATLSSGPVGAPDRSLHTR
jgi:RimJ/RimL family protein N-acetyltransferase